MTGWGNGNLLGQQVIRVPVHVDRGQQPVVLVHVVRPHHRRWTVVIVAPPQPPRSPVVVHVVRPHHLRERLPLRDVVLHGNGADAFCWLCLFDISTSNPCGRAYVLVHRRRQTAGKVDQEHPIVGLVYSVAVVGAGCR